MLLPGRLPTPPSALSCFSMLFPTAPAVVLLMAPARRLAVVLSTSAHPVVRTRSCVASLPLPAGLSQPTTYPYLLPVLSLP